jgi:hypothetical protein
MPFDGYPWPAPRSGVQLLRGAERKHGVCLWLAEATPDRRDPDRIRHAMVEMVMSRVLAIRLGHEDAIASVLI